MTEAIKLVQSGLAERGNVVWMVTADPDVRVQRLIERDGLDFESASRRVAAAVDPSPHASIPVAVIDNSGDRSGLRQRVEAAWQEVEQRIVARQAPARVRDEGENR